MVVKDFPPNKDKELSRRCMIGYTRDQDNFFSTGIQSRRILSTGIQSRGARELVWNAKGITSKCDTVVF